MKCVFCRKCGSLVPMALERRSCKCGNVMGNYLPDGLRIELKLKNQAAVRIVGISNDFLREEFKGWDDPSYKGTLFKGTKSHIIIVLPFTTGDVLQIQPCPTCMDPSIRKIVDDKLVHYCSWCNKHWPLSDKQSKEDE